MKKELSLLALAVVALSGCAMMPPSTGSGQASVTAPAPTPVAATTQPTAVPTFAAQAPAPGEPMGSLQVKDVVLGSGTEAVAGKSVTVNYTGRLLTGKQFDSSVGKAPFVFTLGAGQVIKGWDMGVAGMKVGGKRQLVIPPHLGYGASGAAGVIPPNATLVFDVELLGVQ